MLRRNDHGTTPGTRFSSTAHAPTLAPRRLRLSAAPWAVVCAAMLVSATVRAEDASPHRLHARKIDAYRIDGHLNLGYRATMGLGFRVEIPLYTQGWLTADDVTDEFALTAGADLMFLDFFGRALGPGFWPMVAVQWNLYFNDEWSMFPELGMALLLEDDHYHSDGQDVVDLTFVASFGLRWHFTDRNALVFRINHPAGLQLGITF